jgi:hypothetical protein
MKKRVMVKNSMKQQLNNRILMRLMKILLRIILMRLMKIL